MARSAASSRVDFRCFDGVRIAVEFPDIHRTVCGFAGYEYDPQLGSVLRISLDPIHDYGSTEILISEAEWDGQIVPAADDDCDYCFRPAAR